MFSGSCFQLNLVDPLHNRKIIEVESCCLQIRTSIDEHGEQNVQWYNCDCRVQLFDRLYGGFIAI